MTRRLMILVAAFVSAFVLGGCSFIFDDASGSGTAGSPTDPASSADTTSSNSSASGTSTSGGSASDHTDSTSSTTASTATTSDGMCSEPGAGPHYAEPTWNEGMFPLEPILEQYDRAHCKTVSPAFIHRLVHELSTYMCEMNDAPLGAEPGDLSGATLAALEQQDLPLTRQDLADVLDVEPDKLDAELKRVFRLYLLRNHSQEDKEAWEQWDEMMSGMGSYVMPGLVIVVQCEWGVEGLAQAVELDPTHVAEEGHDDLYQTVLGVTRPEAIELLDQYGISADDQLSSFLSIVQVAPAENGERAALVFLANDELKPLRSVSGADLSVTEAGQPVTADIEAKTLRQIAAEPDASDQFSLSIVLDYSGSMSEEDKQFLEEGLLYFFDTLPDVYRGSLIKFTDEAHVYQPMTGDTDALREAVTAPKQSGGTALYDALAVGQDELESEQTPFHLAIGFTDGQENASETHCHDSVVTRSLDKRIPVFVMGMGDISVPSMMGLSTDTHGCFVYAPSNTQLEAIYRSIGKMLGDAYVVRWPARTDQAAPEVRITVDSADHGHLEDHFEPQR